MNGAIGAALLLALGAAHAASGAVDPRLSQLEAEQKQSEDAHRSGRLAPARFEDFKKDFEPRLRAAARSVSLTAPNASAYARMMARLGRRSDALAGVDQALANDPGNPLALKTKSWVHFRSGNYVDAYRFAEESLANAERLGQPVDQEALSLKYQSAGRVTSQAASGSTAPRASATTTRRADPDTRPFKLPIQVTRRQIDVPVTETPSNFVSLPNRPSIIDRVLLAPLDASFSVRPEEEKKVLDAGKAAFRTGVVVGGVSAAVAATGVCGPSLSLGGVPYPVCVGAAGVGIGVGVGIVAGYSWAGITIVRSRFEDGYYEATGFKLWNQGSENEQR